MHLHVSSTLGTASAGGSAQPTLQAISHVWQQAGPATSLSMTVLYVCLC